MSAPWKRIVRSPALHFVLAGVVLFGLAVLLGREGTLSWRAPSGSAAPASDARDDDPRTIRVERDDLLAFIQARTRMARAEDAAKAFDSAPPAARQDWIDRYVREEALVREARELGLEREDELIRRRLVQQIEFLVEGIGEEALAVTDAEIEAAYRARSREYRQPATFRFAHVFVREFEGYESKAPDRAKIIRDEMNRSRIAFEHGHPYGDRFLYDRVYVDRTLDEVRSHFGDEFAETLGKLPPTPGQWTGPYRSRHGLHLVMLTDRQPARESSLAEVRDQLREELLREKRERALEQAVAAIIAKYEVDLGDGVRGSEK